MGCPGGDRSSKLAVKVPQASEVKRCHLPPCAGTVGATIPHMQLMADILVREQPTEMPVVVEKRISIADGENDVASRSLSSRQSPPRPGRKCIGVWK